MRKIEVTLTQVYRINGHLVVANSIEGAINTWREFMSPNTPEIRSIERMGNDSYQAVVDDALVCAEGLFGEDFIRIQAEKEKLTYELEKREAYCADLEKRIQELSACAGK